MTDESIPLSAYADIPAQGTPCGRLFKGDLKWISMHITGGCAVSGYRIPHIKSAFPGKNPTV